MSTTEVLHSSFDGTSADLSFDIPSSALSMSTDDDGTLVPATARDDGSPIDVRANEKNYKEATSISTHPLTELQKQWIEELKYSVELETMSILYAKSILDATYVGRRVDRPSSSPKPQGLPGLLAPTPPAKPKRCIARMTPSHNANNAPTCQVPSATASTISVAPTEQCYKSTICLPSAAAESTDARPRPTVISINGPSPHLLRRSIRKVMPTMFASRKKSADANGERFAQSLPHNVTMDFRMSQSYHEQRSEYADAREIFASSVPDYSQLPLCEPTLARLRPKNRRGSMKVLRPPPDFRHSIRVNEEDTASTCTFENSMRISNGAVYAKVAKKQSTNQRQAKRPSPNSSSSTSSSTDSGQCSETSPSTLGESNRRATFDPDVGFVDYSEHLKRSLPSYPRMASVMDHILRTCSTLYSLLNSDTQQQKVAQELFHKANVYIQLLRQSPCANHLPHKDIDAVLQAMRDCQRDAVMCGTELAVSDYFSIVLRKMILQTLLIFAKIIPTYLSQCDNKDRLLTIALEQLVHLLLFGDELCLEAIRYQAVDNLIAFCRMLSTPTATIKLMLRALAVLCGVSKGCLQLLSIGGLDVVIHILCSSPSFECAVEAAGVLTQLTNPGSSYAKLHNSFSPVILRLISLVDECCSAESLLLTAAAIANLSLQSPLAVDLMYQHNLVLRLVRGFNAYAVDNVFVQEQAMTIFARMANRGYDQALISQGAIPMMFRMLHSNSESHVEYCRRIRYKAAVCLATIAASSFGLKAIHDHHGYDELSEVLQMENQQPGSALALICNTIKQRLENTFQLESAV